LVERRSPKPEAEGSSPSAPANFNIRNKIMKNPIKFIQDVKQEAFKVTWPSAKETMQGALMVFAMALVMSLFFLLLDQILKYFLELLLRVSI
jgi:preprotein translocase subunit SecE